ncbi:MAG: oligosaccharide flippase family protein, partial [Gammaproteobacteria bacterium]|nr:oligosaccharide flippase family protein [Gammaproteobacteria bacterium]
MAESLGQSIRRNTLWIFAGSAAGRVFSFAIGIVLARILVPEDFGLIVAIQVFTGAAGFIAGGGMGEALVQAKNAGKREFGTVFSLQLGICLVIYAFFWVIAPHFANWLDDPRYEPLLQVAALSFVFRPFVNVPQATLRRDMRFKVISLIQLVIMFFSGALSIYFALIGMGPWA